MNLAGNTFRFCVGDVWSDRQLGQRDDTNDRLIGQRCRVLDSAQQNDRPRVQRPSSSSQRRLDDQLGVTPQ